MLYVALFFILISLFLLWQASRQKRQSGLPGGRIIYIDTSRWLPQDQSLYSASLNLTGKPDYLIQQGRYTIPIEVKKVRNPDQLPYDTHIYQLAAYCLLVSDTYEQRPPYGILHYSDGERSRSYAVDYTPALEAAVRQILAEISTNSRQKELVRSHDNPSRCRGCGYRYTCDQSISQ